MAASLLLRSSMGNFSRILVIVLSSPRAHDAAHRERTGPGDCSRRRPIQKKTGAQPGPREAREPGCYNNRLARLGRAVDEELAPGFWLS